MPATLEYLRPQTLGEALMLLRRSDVRTVPLAGGTWLVPRLRRDVEVSDPLADRVDAVVDLADLGLDGIDLEGEPGAGWVTLGATATLTQVAESLICREVAGGILAQAAQRAAPVNQRNAATVAGATLSASSQSELLLALLVLEGQIVVNDGEPRAMSLHELLADPGQLAGGLATAVRVPWPAATVGGGLARVARTPGDAPIVAVAAAVDGAGRRLAVGGVAAASLRLHLAADEDLERALNAALDGVELLSDWQGSSEYRRALAPVLSQRALDAAAG